MNYEAYISSPAWKAKSRRWIKQAGKCEKCRKTYTLTCHHKHYETLGEEKREDITVLCWNCHRKYHYTSNGQKVNQKDYRQRLAEIRKNKPVLRVGGKISIRLMQEKYAEEEK